MTYVSNTGSTRNTLSVNWDLGLRQFVETLKNVSKVQYSMNWKPVPSTSVIANSDNSHSKAIKLTRRILMFKRCLTRVVDQRSANERVNMRCGGAWRPS